MQTQTLVAPEVVGAKLVEWYSCIVARDLDQAIELKKTSEDLLLNMINDETVETHYKLVNLRHQFLQEEHQIDLSEEKLIELKSKAESSNDKLKYLYYYMTAQYEYYNNRYKSAIRIYHISENLFHSVDNVYEKAELYQRLGFCYYRMDDYTSAVKYIKLAITIYDQNQKYEERRLNCKLVLAYVATELSMYEKAEGIYEDLLRNSYRFPATNAHVLRGVGLNRIRQDRFEEAKNFLTHCLNTNELKNPILKAKAQYNLANTLYRLGENEKAKYLLDQAEEKSLEFNMIEHIAKCTITRGLYEKLDVEQIIEGLELLERNELLFEYSEMTKEISDYYESKGQIQLALDYLKLAYKTPSNLKVLEGSS